MNHSCVLTEQTQLQDVIRLIDEGGIGFLAFINQEGKLLGIITDGDLRRAMLNKVSDLNKIINFHPEVMKSDAPLREIIRSLKKIHVRHMPLVDTQGVLTKVFSLDDLEFASQDNIVVVMAGGLGSRLGELTKNTPKPMLKVGDKPMLQLLVEQFRDQGFTKFIFCLNYKKEIIQEYFSDGAEYGIELDYVIESKRLGTAGALSILPKSKFNKPFFVINADILTSLNFNEALQFHIDSGVAATMCVRQFQHQIPYGVVETRPDMQVVSIQEKPILNFDVNAGIYVLNPELIDMIPADEFFDMPTLFQTLLDKGISTAAYRLMDYWVDIGRKEDLAKANSDVNSDQIIF